MEIGICTAVLLAIPGTALVAGCIYGGYRLWSWAWEKVQLDKLRKKMNKTYPLVAIAFVAGLSYLTFSNVKFISCDKSVQSAQVASAPCTCGCGRHK